MILPASYLNGFAPRDGQPLYPSLWTGCVGAWNPGLGPSGLVLRDQSGFSRHGTLTNGPTFAASQGKYAMSFDGVDDYVDLGNSTQYRLGPSNSFSICAWADITLGSSNRVIMGNGFSTKGYHVRLTTSNTIRFIVLSTGSDYVFSDSSVITSRWYHVAGVWNKTNTIVYVDGICFAGFTAGGTLGDFAVTTNLFIGQSENAGFALGKIDDSRFYNRALSPDEIRTLATRRGIAYEMAPRRRSSAQVTVAPLRYNLFSGSIGNTDVIGAS